MFDNLRKYRKFLGIPLKKAALDCGVSHGTIGDLETGCLRKIKNKEKQAAIERYYAKLERQVKKQMTEM